MGHVASSVDNALIESFWSTMQRELLDRQHWSSRIELASAIRIFFSDGITGGLPIVIGPLQQEPIIP